MLCYATLYPFFHVQLRVHPLEGPACLFSPAAAATEAGPGVSPLTHELQRSFGSAMVAHCVTSWEALEQAWRHAFWRLGRCEGDVGDAVAPEGCPILLTTHALAPWRDVARSAEVRMGCSLHCTGCFYLLSMQLLFETFGATAVHVAVDAALSLASSDPGPGGSSTGVVLEIGDGRALAVPVYEGHVIRSGVVVSNESSRVGRVLPSSSNAGYAWRRTRRSADAPSPASSHDWPPPPALVSRVSSAWIGREQHGSSATS